MTGTQTGSKSGTVIEARSLSKHFATRLGILRALAGTSGAHLRALDGIDLSIKKRSVMGLVGESGCGKSTLGMTLVRMHEPTMGDIIFNGVNVTRARGSDLKAYRGKAQIIFQDPYSSLNPRLTVGQLIEEPLRIHHVGNRAERYERVAQAMEHVRMPIEDFQDRYPSDLSGGQRQRVAIARALVMEPDFIVADEPVSMLDVSIQASVLELLDKLSHELGLGVLYISHDIATVGYICDSVAVMYLGRIVEQGSVTQVLSNPMHPYTRALMSAIPRIDPSEGRVPVELPGGPQSPLEVTVGCRFAKRCVHATDECFSVEPGLEDTGGDHFVRCHLYTSGSAFSKTTGTGPS